MRVREAHRSFKITPRPTSEGHPWFVTSERRLGLSPPLSSRPGERSRPRRFLVSRQRPKRRARPIADSQRPQDTKSLRICAAKNQPPLSLEDGSGLENKIGVALAEAMDLKPQYVWSDRPAIYLVRDYLDKKLCDVVIGLDTGDTRVVTSSPYYRSGYVFITRADRDLDIESWADPRVARLGHVA